MTFPFIHICLPGKFQHTGYTFIILYSTFIPFLVELIDLLHMGTKGFKASQPTNGSFWQWAHNQIPAVHPTPSMNLAPFFKYSIISTLTKRPLLYLWTIDKLLSE